ncbi:hypothetical protein GCM10027271_26460 [Saccharopolyspora gloriosae]
MPKTISAPTDSSDRTSDCAPVTCAGASWDGAGLERCPGGGAGTGLCLVWALVIEFASVRTVVVGEWARKNPRRAEKGTVRGLARRRCGASSGVDAPGKYENVVQSQHGEDVNGTGATGSNHAGRDSRMVDAENGSKPRFRWRFPCSRISRSHSAEPGVAYVAPPPARWVAGRGTGGATRWERSGRFAGACGPGLCGPRAHG